MKKERAFGIVFIVVCVLVICALPIYTLLAYGKVNSQLSTWIRANFRDNRNPIGFYVTITMHGDHKRLDMDSYDLSGEVTSDTGLWQIVMDRSEGIIMISRLSGSYTVDGKTIDVSSGTGSETYYVDLSGETVKLRIVSRDGSEEREIGDRYFRDTLYKALMPDDVEVFTELVRRPGEAGFTDGKMDISNYITVSSARFLSALSGFVPDITEIGDIRLQYSMDDEDEQKRFTVILNDEASSSGKGVTDLFETWYQVFTGCEYSNCYTDRDIPYHIDIIIEFLPDMYSFRSIGM